LPDVYDNDPPRSSSSEKSWKAILSFFVNKTKWIFIFEKQSYPIRIMRNKSRFPSQGKKQIQKIGARS
jgi:hypothetical protein